MSMSKKHYVSLAVALKETRPTRPNEVPMSMGEAGQADAMYDQWSRDLKAIASVMAQDNPNFDRNRFLEACGKLKKED